MVLLIEELLIIHDKAVFMGADMFARLQDRLMPL